jgi:hypothetical protein
LVGSKDFLNIRWNAKDPGGIERVIGVDCWLNCPASSDLVSQCSGYQSCNYRGPTGDHACSITQPGYDYTAENSVVCRFFDPILPSLDLEVQNRTFKMADYLIDTPPITMTVGSASTLPIDVKSYGMLPTPFTSNISALQSPQLVYIKNAVGTTEEASCGEVVRVFPSITFLSSGTIPFSILSRATADDTSCQFDYECSYLDDQIFDSQCADSVCWKRLDLTIRAGSASLPEYSLLGFLLIAALSTALVFFSRDRI